MGVITTAPTFLLDLALEGQQARGETHWLRTTNAKTASQLPFGRWVKRTGWDASNRITLVDVLEAGDTAADVFGLSKFANHETTARYNTITSPGEFPAYEAGEECTIVKQGTFWMVTVDAATVGDQVYAVLTAGNADEVGRVRATADASAVALPTANFQFYTNAAAGELVEVYFDIA